MKIELDLKTLVTLGGIVAMLSGFVYTTTLRLDNIEEQVIQLEEEQAKLVRRTRVKSNKPKIQKQKKGTKHDQKK